ncbi:MAG: helix-turn-helix domain-containing protein [Aminipila sp.]
MYKTFDDLPLYLTIKDLQKIFGIGQVQAYELAHSEGFPAMKVGGAIRIMKPLLIEWIKKQSKEQLT